MTWQDILERLEALCPVYELAAPGAVKRCIVWHKYGETFLLGDDHVLLSAKKFQIDVLTQSSSDSLSEDVTAVLDEADTAWWTEADSSYDPDYALWRTIIQTEVV